MTLIHKCTIVALLLLAVATVSLARDPQAYVINTSGETLSRINIATGQVANDILTLGSDIHSYPNQIIVQDTLAYVLCSGTDEIQVIDLEREITLDYIDLGSGFSPYWMAFLDTQYVYVTSFEYDKLVKVDVLSGQTVGEWPIGLSPEGVLIDDARVYVAITAFDKNNWTYGQGKVVVFDTETDSVDDEFAVGANPQYLAKDSLGRIHVICTGDYWSAFGEVHVYDPSLGTVIDDIELGGSPGNLTIGPDNTAFVAAGGWYGPGHAYSYDALTLDVHHGSANPLVVDSGCMMVVAFQDSSMFVGAFKDYVTRHNSMGVELNRWAVGDGPVHVDFNYVPGDLDGTFEVDIADLVSLVNWFFKDGPAPAYERWLGSINGDRWFHIGDVVYLVNYMFKGGASPKAAPRWL